MSPNKRTSAKSGQKLRKNLRPHRKCPHCGQIQPGIEGRAAKRKLASGKIRKSRSAELSATPVAAQSEERAAKSEPIDSLTVIKGVVARIQEVLEGGDFEETPTTALNKAVRQAVLDEFRTRAQFAGRLAEIDAMLWSQGSRGDGVTDGAMDAHLRELRLLRVTVPEENERFVVTEGEGDAFELLRPAYVDEMTGKVILSGQLRRVGGATATEAGEAR